MIEARVIEKVLTDGSKAYDVEIRQIDILKSVAATGGDMQVITLPANTAGQADLIVKTVVELVNRHTQEQAKRTD